MQQGDNKGFTPEQERFIWLLIGDYMKSSAYTARKLADTPTDALSVVPRKYVNLNGALASRPPSSVATVGQRYFATDTNIPMTYTGTNWVDGVGSVVAST